MKISVRGLHKYWETPSGTLKVLENVNIEIQKGEFIAIMGPSGSGKSTFLHLLGCIDLPNIGHILMEEVDVTQQPENVREKIRLKYIGFVFQNYNLLPTLRVVENVILPMQLMGIGHSEQIARAESLLRLVNLDRRARDPVINLSGGEQQRVAITRALANMPGLILADEPTGNLDLRSSREIMEVMRTINENQQITTILVTHDPKVASFAQKVYYLGDGKLRATAI
jgi:putative ABC transport system ATP-binding protein